MSSGRAHSRATLALTIPAGMLAASVLTGSATNNMIAGCVGCLSGLIIEPDLDVDGVTKSEWEMIKKFWILGMVWVTLWYPYAWLIPHRSPLSHFPLIGTAGRVFYLMIVITAVTALFHIRWSVMDAVNHPAFTPWFVGLVVTDTAHYVMDLFSTKVKRFARS
jgi:uncharacterized metal-binding protein